MPTVRTLSRTAPSAKTLAPERSSPRLRGYSSTWDRFSANYRRINPFCVECRRISGRLVYEDVLVDHKYPVSDGGAMYPGSGGVWTLCRPHHGWKDALEEYARSTDQMDMIVFWCDNPESRPAGIGTLQTLHGCTEDGS